jgi:Type II secretion system (T2SS), protein M subtype b
MSDGTRKSRISRQGYFGMAIIAVAVLGLAAAAAAPFYWQQAMQPELEESRRMLALIEQKLKDAEANRKPQAVTAQNAPQAFVEGTTAGLATAGLQRVMVDLAKANAMRVERVQPLPAEINGSLARLRLDIEVTGSLEGLRNYLLAIESGAPLIFARELHVAAPPNRDEGQNPYPSETLTVSLQVEAYSWWGPQS